MTNVDMQTCHPRREGWLGLKVKRRKLPKHVHQFHLFFLAMNNIQGTKVHITLNYDSVHSDFVTIFTHLSSISKNTNKQKIRKKNVYGGDRKS